MKNEMIRRSLILAVGIAMSLSAFGAQAPRDEQTRAELLDYVSLFSTFPHRGSKLAEENISCRDAEQSIRALSAEELRMVDQAIANIPTAGAASRVAGRPAGQSRVFDESLRVGGGHLTQQMIA